MKKNYGSTFDVIDIPEILKLKLKSLEESLLKLVAEYDENLLEKYFDDPDSITEDEIHAATESCDSRYKYYSNGMWLCF